MMIQIVFFFCEIQSVGTYWTDKDAVFGLFEVRVTGVDKREEFSAWTYELTHKGKVK